MAGEINKTYTSNSLYNDSTGVIAFAEQLKQELINWANYQHVTEELGKNRPDLQNELNNLFLSVYERFLTFLNDADASEEAINTWKEIENFLADYTDDKTLASIVAELNSRIESRLTVPLESTTGSSTTSTMTQKAITEAIDTSKTFTTGEKVDNIGIDAEPTAGSDNLVKSRGVQKELALGAVYDVSAKNPTAGPNNEGKWESLSALLSDANINTIIPASVRKGGMSVKFIQSSDNRYVQYFLAKDEWSINADYWEKINLEENVSQLDQKVSGLEVVKEGAFIGGWVINENGYRKDTTNTRVGIEEFHLEAGDKIKSSDYNVCRFWIGWKDADGVYGNSGAWTTADFVAPVSGTYVVSISGRPAFTVTNPDELTIYFSIERNHSQIAINANDIKELFSEQSRIYNELSGEMDALAEDVSRAEESVSDVESDVATINETLIGTSEENYTPQYINKSGSIVDNDDYRLSVFVPINGEHGFRWYHGTDIPIEIRAEIFDVNKEPFLTRKGALGLMVPSGSADNRTFGNYTLSQSYDNLANIKYVRISFKKGFVGKVEDPVTNEILYQAETTHNPGLIEQVANKVSYPQGTQEYLGDRLSLNVAQKKGYKCDVELAFSVPYGDGTDKIWLHQSMAIYNNILFSFREEAVRASVDLIDISTWTRLGAIEMADGYASHKNNAQFTNVFYDVDDEFPLLILSRGDYGVTNPNKPYNIFYVYRVLVNNGVYSMQFIKSISASKTDIPETKFNGSWFVDSNQNRLFLYTFTIAPWNDTEARPKNRGLIYEFQMPDLVSQDTVELTKADIVRMSTTPFHIWQGACGYSGKMFAPVGYGIVGTLDDYNEPLNTSVLVLDEDSFAVSNVLPWLINYEPEGCAIWDNALYVAFHHSNNASPDDLCFGVYKYTFH